MRGSFGSSGTRSLAFAVLLAIAAFALLAPAAIAKPVKRGIYAGKTSAGGKVELEVASNAKEFRTGKISFTAKCSDGSQFSDFFPGEGLPISGDFIEGHIDFTDKKTGGRVVIDIEGTFSADGKDITGTASFKVIVGGVTCDSGVLNFDADFVKQRKKKKKKKKRKHRAAQFVAAAQTR